MEECKRCNNRKLCRSLAKDGFHDLSCEDVENIAKQEQEAEFERLKEAADDNVPMEYFESGGIW